MIFVHHSHFLKFFSPFVKYLNNCKTKQNASRGGTGINNRSFTLATDILMFFWWDEGSEVRRFCDEGALQSKWRRSSANRLTTVWFFGDNTRFKLKIAFFLRISCFSWTRWGPGLSKGSGFSTPPLLPWEINLHKCLMGFLLLWCSLRWGLTLMLPPTRGKLCCRSL